MSNRRPGSRHYAVLNRGRWRHARKRTLERDGYRCRTCGRAGRLEVDHVVPLQRGGEPYSAANLQALCADCHVRKTRSEAMRPRTAAEIRWGKLVESTYNDESETQLWTV